MMEWKMVLLFLLAGGSAYLISGLNPAIILSKLIYHDDIRLKGSKNPGFTNFKRVYGNRCAWYVFVLDILKSVLPCIIFAWLFEHSYGHWQLGAAYTGLFSMIGHIFPVWYGFKGGKGFLVEVGAVYVIDWRAGLIATAVFLILLFTLKYMSLSSICFALLIKKESIPFALAARPSDDSLSPICRTSPADIPVSSRNILKRSSDFSVL